MTLARVSGAAIAGVALLALSALAADPPYQVGDQKSGYMFLPPDLQAMQNDDLGNQGLLWVERGEKQWSEVAGTAGKSCASCHGDAKTSMKGVRARYPAWSDARQKPIDIEQRINQCRTEQMKAPALDWESGFRAIPGSSPTARPGRRSTLSAVASGSSPAAPATSSRPASTCAATC